MIVDCHRTPLPTVFLATMRTALTVSVLLQHLCFLFVCVYVRKRVCVYVRVHVCVHVCVWAKPLVV